MNYFLIFLSFILVLGFIFLSPKDNESILSSNSKKTKKPLSKIDFIFFILGSLFMFLIYIYNINGGNFNVQ